jgi:solute carrier family 25 (mitochondrial oxoglutarate transporter), member 11
MSSNNSAPTNGLAKALQPYVVGGGSAIFASICVQPMDLTKTRMQLMPKGTSPVTVARDIIAKDGIKGLYAGVSASIMRQAVYGTARLGLHREISDYLKREQIAAGGAKDLPGWKSAGSAMVSGAVASIIGTPFDVSLVRMQADGMKPVAERRGYTNVFNALARITREEGLLKLWTGFEPTAFRAIAMNVGMMASYDQAKQAITKINGEGTTTNLLSSAVSGLTASLTSLPFDMMKTRLQNMKPDPTTGLMPYRNVLDCGFKIATQEGVLTFWRGFSAYYARTAPHAMIILIVMEQFNSWWKKTFNT